MSQTEYLPIASKPIVEIFVHWCVDSPKEVICTFAGNLPGSILSCPLTTSAQVEVDRDHQRSVDIPLTEILPRNPLGIQNFRQPGVFKVLLVD